EGAGLPGNEGIDSVLRYAGQRAAAQTRLASAIKRPRRVHCNQVEHARIQKTKGEIAEALRRLPIAEFDIQAARIQLVHVLLHVHDVRDEPVRVARDERTELGGALE